MRRLATVCLLLALLPSLTLAQAPEKPRIVKDVWNAAYLQGAQAGYVHTQVQEIARDGQKIYFTTTELKLTVKRNEDTIQLRMENATDETADGKVLHVIMRQTIGK